MTFFIIWAIVLGAVVAIGALIWSVRALARWVVAKYPRYGREAIFGIFLTLFSTAYIACMIWSFTV